MRLRLFHTLSLTLLAFAGVAVLALGGLTAWQLRNGFSDYLAKRDVQHFERLVNVLEARIARDEVLSDFLAGRLVIQDFLDELNPPSNDPLGPASMLGKPPPPHGRNPEAFPERIQIRAINGALLLGPSSIDVPGSTPIVERPVHAQGQVVATARMRPAPVVRNGAEANFLRDQYVLMALGSLSLIVLALVIATKLASRWTQPLDAVVQATHRLAQGELTVRLPVTPTLASRSDEIGDVIRNVNHMAEGLQKMEATRRRWLADISHELRTPLTVLRGDIEALHEGVRPLNPEAIEVLHEEVLRLSRLVDDLHLLAISDLQTLPCHMVEDDAISMLKRMQARYQDRAEVAGLSLNVEWPENIAVVSVHWDAGRIEQLMCNLLDNSLRYTQSPGKVLIRLELRNEHVELVVEDSAPGVSSDQLPQLFEALFRGDVARSSGSGGSGLGLAICQIIAKAHDGQLTVSASNLGGLALTLKLPKVAAVQPSILKGSTT